MMSLSLSAYLPLIITNLGVTNVGMIGATKYVTNEYKDDTNATTYYS